MLIAVAPQHFLNFFQRRAGMIRFAPICLQRLGHRELTVGISVDISNAAVFRLIES